jgi:voltage-dependent calcium channel alpha-2/delta-3
MLEIEQMDDDRPSRDFNPHLIGIRNSIIEQSTGSKWMLAKQQIDDMMRVSRLRR